MKADREQLEAAARAIGLRVEWEPAHGVHWIEPGQGLKIEPWTPHEDDAQAFRLASALGMHVDFSRHDPGVEWPVSRYEAPGDDPTAATRLAIVRAAAAMPPKETDPSVQAGVANMARKIDDDIFHAALKAAQHGEPLPMTDAQLLALKAERDAAKEVEARVAGELQRRLNAMVHGGPTMVANEERSRRAVAAIVREVVDAEVQPLPFEVLVDMHTDPHRLQINFAYPLWPSL